MTLTWVRWQVPITVPGFSETISNIREEMKREERKRCADALIDRKTGAWIEINVAQKSSRTIHPA
jgi:hypothetical protein